MDGDARDGKGLAVDVCQKMPEENSDLPSVDEPSNQNENGQPIDTSSQEQPATKETEPAKETKNTDRKPEATFYTFDRSGSMSSMGDAPSEALFQEIREKLAEAIHGDYVYIQAFDDRIDPPLHDGPVSQIKLTLENIKKGLKPRDRTALNDSFAALLKKAMTFHEANPGHEVAAVVYTDGAENSSKEYGGPEGLKKVSALVHKARDMGIEVIFMAANIDAFATGDSYGVPQRACLQAGQRNFVGLKYAKDGIRQKNICRSKGFGFTEQQIRSSSEEVPRFQKQ
ncbi:uncharacterized protein LOC110249393 isoform X2 [Exaiptasia diaphana]|uniref:VWFA domain-containing protein n=1 Tax=Exaiptasia diaphana TaxID=2652724 RepID=A0A913XY55_EXADI|nr:uncharacterized protein LOC110249393 isoform X2 [Exaiptasia diaphana]